MDRRELLNDPEEAQRLVLDGRLSCLWTSFPAIVQSVNLAKMTCEVQPAIQGTVENEDGSVTFVNLPLLVDCPLVFPSAGGFIITLPIAQGDEVLVNIAARCIDAWWQSGGIQKPMEARMHDLSDGFIIPGPRSVPKAVASISATALQIRNDAGTQYIELSADGKIKIVSSEVTVQGNLKVTGTITGQTGTVPVNLGTHVHTGVTTGLSNTGGPV